jgi:hypothetical protein
MNDNKKLDAAFDPRDGDPHHIAAQEDEDSAWPYLVRVFALLAAVCFLVCSL